MKINKNMMVYLLFSNLFVIVSNYCKSPDDCDGSFVCLNNKCVWVHDGQTQQTYLKTENYKGQLSYGENQPKLQFQDPKAKYNMKLIKQLIEENDNPSQSIYESNPSIDTYTQYPTQVSANNRNFRMSTNIRYPTHVSRNNRNPGMSTNIRYPTQPNTYLSYPQTQTSVKPDWNSSTRIEPLVNVLIGNKEYSMNKKNASIYVSKGLGIIVGSRHLNSDLKSEKKDLEKNRDSISGLLSEKAWVREKRII